MPPPDVPVLIVGAGPTGSMASLLLEQLGIETRIVERRPGPARPPAAHAVNARTLEICRSAGVDMEAIARAASDPADAGFVYWVTKLGGRSLGRLRYEQQKDDQLGLTPTPLRNLSQNRFEPIVLEALRRRAGRAPEWKTEWLASAEEADVVCTRVRDLETGSEREIRSRYLIAADGAGSPIRKSLAIDVVGPARIQSFVMVHLRTKLRGIPEVPPGLLFFVCDPASGGGVFVVHDLDREAVYMLPYDPDVETVDDYDPQRCAELVRGALEDPSRDFDVEAVSTWAMTAQVAERYRAGRVFLAGDAAHRFPPTGGLGLNTGVQDAHNLVWKIAAVLGAQASPDLLETYETERRPIAQMNAEQSLKNAVKLFEVIGALGITDASNESRARMEAVLADPADRARLDEAIANQAEHFDMPGLQLGFCYENGAMSRGDDDLPPALQVRHFEPTGRPGSRLPHAWIGGEVGGESLLDRVAPGRFLLLVGPDGSAWIDAMASVRDRPVDALVLNEELLPDLERWLEVAGIGRVGALLVRPDQHVAWRRATLAASPDLLLERVFDTVLPRA